MRKLEGLDAWVARFPEDVRSVVRVFYENESTLSDGFKFYCDAENDESEIETLTGIAREIVSAVQ